MSEILREAAVEALHEMDVRYLVDPENGAMVVPYETAGGARLLLNIQTDDEQEDAIIYTLIAPVPARRAARVALLLAELNAHYKFVVFSLDVDAVRADICIELSYASDPSALIGLAYQRLTHALEETYPRIERRIHGKQRRPRAMREAEHILDELNF